jgi:hypothetical protein
MRRRRRPTPPPTVRDLHHAYIATLTDADLNGDPQSAYIDDPNAWRTVSSTQMGTYTIVGRTHLEEATVLDPDDLPIPPTCEEPPL